MYFAYLKATDSMPKHFKAQLAKEYKADILKLGEIGEEHLSHYHPNVPLRKFYQKPKQSTNYDRRLPSLKRRFNPQPKENRKNKATPYPPRLPQDTKTVISRPPSPRSDNLSHVPTTQTLVTRPRNAILTGLVIKEISNLN